MQDPISPYELRISFQAHVALYELEGLADRLQHDIAGDYYTDEFEVVVVDTRDDTVEHLADDYSNTAPL